MGLRISNGFFKISNGVFRSIEPLISSGGGPLTYTVTELLTTAGAGTWTKPTGVTSVTVECWGGGGGGGGATSAPAAGAGGGGGQYAKKIITYSSAQQSISYNIGTSGTGGTSVGGNGADSTWETNIVIAKGGTGGQANAIDGGPSVSGGLGNVNGSVGDLIYFGGNGFDGVTIDIGAGVQPFSGGGGGGAGSTASGSTPTTSIGGLATLEFGGSGGDGGSSEASSNGLAGNVYGGGGGGASKISGTNRSGGNGAQGLIRVSYQVQPPLQTYTGSNAAYSIRQLSTEATASMQVQRSSDNAVLDIGFQADGMLDTGSLLTFVGAGSGYVKFWYDQTGGGYTLWVFNDAIISQWPVIVSSGSLVTTNGKPALRFTAGQTMIIANGDQSYTTGGGEWFQFAVAQSADATTRLLTKIGNSVEIAQSMRRSATALESIGYNTAGGTGTDSNGVSPGTAQFIAYSQRTSTGVEIYMNGTSNGETAVAGTPRTEALSTIVIGSFNPATLSFPWSGSVQEVIHYPQDSATFTYRTGLTAELNAYYGTF